MIDGACVTEMPAHVCATCRLWKRHPMHSSFEQRYGDCNLKQSVLYERSADAWVDTREDFYCAAWEARTDG